MVSYVLNELSDGMRELFFDKARLYLTDGGYLIIIESAYRGVRRYVWDFLRDREVRENFRMVYASVDRSAQSKIVNTGVDVAIIVLRRRI